MYLILNVQILFLAILSKYKYNTHMDGYVLLDGWVRKRSIYNMYALRKMKI